MKCKFCGSEIGERQRFCLNCGMTVRHVKKSSAMPEDKRRTAQNKPAKVRKPVQNKGGQRPSKPDSYSRYNTYMMDKKRKERKARQKKIQFRRRVLLIVLLAIVVSIISAVIAFNKTKESGIANINPNATISPTIDPMAFPSEDIKVIDGNATEEPTEGASSEKKATAEPSSKPTSSPTTAPGKVKEGYSSYKEVVSGIVCPYPSGFEKSDVTSSVTKISITDGTAELRINTEKATTQDTANSLLKEYSSGIGVNPTESGANDGVYTISFVRNGKYNHRTGVVHDGRHIYYDFACPENEGGNSSYTEITTYMDSFLKEQIKNLQD